MGPQSCHHCTRSMLEGHVLQGDRHLERLIIEGEGRKSQGMVSLCIVLCGDADHNRKGCKTLKAGLPPPNVPPPNDQPSSNVPPPNEGNAGVNVTPPNEGVVAANVAPPYGDLMVDNMIAQVLLISSSNVHSL